MKNEANLFEKISCPFCSALTFQVVYSGSYPKKFSRDFLTRIYRSSSDQKLFEQVVRCTDCGLVYLNPRLASNLIIDSYSEGEDQAFIEQDGMRIRTFSRVLKQLSRKFNIKLAPETRALDIGCAGGAFLCSARQLGLSAIGIEPNKWLGDYARSKFNLDVRIGTLSDHALPESSFDIVTLWDVIEHLSNPDYELEKIHAILRPGGLLVINYPDFGSLIARIFGKKWPFLLSVHLVYYTRKTICKQLSKKGFKILDIKPHWQTLELGYILKRASSYFPFVKFFEKLVNKVRLGSIPIKYWMGQTQVIAKKC
jgi:SAM-dependent methyltransferase